MSTLTNDLPEDRFVFKEGVYYIHPRNQDVVTEPEPVSKECVVVGQNELHDQVDTQEMLFSEMIFTGMLALVLGVAVMLMLMAAAGLISSDMFVLGGAIDAFSGGGIWRFSGLFQSAS